MTLTVRVPAREPVFDILRQAADLGLPLLPRMLSSSAGFQYAAIARSLVLRLRVPERAATAWPTVSCCTVSRIGAYATPSGRPPSSAAGAPDAVPEPAVRGAVPRADAGYLYKSRVRPSYNSRARVFRARTLGCAGLCGSATVPAALGSRVASSSNEAMLPGVLKLRGPPSPCPSLTEGEGSPLPEGYERIDACDRVVNFQLRTLVVGAHIHAGSPAVLAMPLYPAAPGAYEPVPWPQTSIRRPWRGQRFSVEIGAGWFNQHVRICAGGAQQCASLRQPRIPARPVDEPGGKPLNMARPNRNLNVAYPGLRVRLVISPRARDFTHARSIVHFVHICPPIAFSFPWRNNPPKTDAGRSSRCGRRPGRHREERRASLGLRRETARTHEGKDAANLAKRGADGSQRASNAGQKASGASQRPQACKPSSRSNGYAQLGLHRKPRLEIDTVICSILSTAPCAR